ncbi:integrase, catalytic region, zinc finger, CCHC-type containing protein [Tanacetum coccineum]
MFHLLLLMNAGCPNRPLAKVQELTKPKSEDTNQEKLYLLHMDLCRPMRVASVNGKKYLRYVSTTTLDVTWVNSNGVVERQNRTLIEAARTMLIYAKAPLFLWAEAVAIACYTMNRSMIRRRHDSDNLGKLQQKADMYFIGYAPTKKAFRIYNRRTRRIIETIHVDFDELTAMASEHSSSGPALHDMTPVTISSGLVPNPPPSTTICTTFENLNGIYCFNECLDESLKSPTLC